MSKTRHTLGPWEVVEPISPVGPGKEDDRLIAARGAEGQLVHVAETFQYQCHQHNKADGTSLANALLIAAAPDMLKALEAIVADNYGQPRGVTVPALDVARAAIAKATVTP